MGEEKAEGLKGTLAGWVKGLLTSIVGLVSGAFLMYLTPVVNNVIKPPKPLANFASQVNGLAVNFNNRSTGGVQGWWDFGDGSALEPFDPKLNNITHAYAKPGTYSVKLALLNLIGETGERTAPVTIDADSTPKPEIISFGLNPIAGEHVPAVYRLKCQAKNASFCILSFGDSRRTEIADVAAIDGRIVTFEQTGAFTVRLAAVNGKDVVEKTEDVFVGGGTGTELMAKLKTVYDAVKVERRVKDWKFRCDWQPGLQENLSPIHKDRPADPGFSIVSAELAKKDAVIGNLRIEVAADKSKVLLTGELEKPADSAPSNALLPPGLATVHVVMERRSPVQTIDRGDVMMPILLNRPMTIPMQKLEDGWEVVRKQVSLEIWDGNRKAWSGNQAVSKVPMMLNNQTCFVTALPQKDGFALTVAAPVAPAPIPVVTPAPVPVPTPITTRPPPRVGPYIRPASFDRSPLVPAKTSGN